MKKIFLIAIMCMVACLFLVGCGENNEPINENNVTNVEENNNYEEVTGNAPEDDMPDVAANTPEDEMSDVSNNTYEDENTFVDDDEIIEFDDEPNQAPEEDMGIVKVDESAQGLVYAYYLKIDANLTFGDVLTNYTTDFTTIKTSEKKQRRAFLGFKLDENNRIQRAYSCLIYNGVLYALEGTTDGSSYNSNRAIMNRMFTPEDIQIDKSYHYYAVHDDSVVDVWDDGRVTTHYELGATINSRGEIYCT